MNYTEAAMSDMVGKEKSFDSFFLNVKHIIRQQNVCTVEQKWKAAEKSLHSQLLKVQVNFFQCSGWLLQASVDTALKDSFNTPVAMAKLLDLVSAANVYMREQPQPRLLLLKKIANYITQMLNIFGLIEGTLMGVTIFYLFYFPEGEIGFTSGESTGQSKEQVLTPVLDALAQFRSDVRKATATKDMKEVLNVCDNLRDEVLPPLGVKLEVRRFTTTAM